RMLDMGFINPIRRIAAETREDRQTLLFSATMSKDIRALAQSLLHEPEQIAVTPVASAAPKIEQSLYHVQRPEKQGLLTHLLADAAMSRVVVFTKTKHGADRVGEKLERAGISARTIHGNKGQNQRTRALAAFKRGDARVLVATDVAARGLDVDDITHVVNFDLPMEPEAYVHRIGRTGRAGATGIAISFCDNTERALLKDIERLLQGKIPQVRTPMVERAPRGEHHSDRGVIVVDRTEQRERQERPRPQPPHAGNRNTGRGAAPGSSPGTDPHRPGARKKSRRPNKAQRDHAESAAAPRTPEFGAPRHQSGPRHTDGAPNPRSFNAHNRRTRRR
ncbi:MAG: DEAD/DEAH box helicase, partial [Phycisphaerales bacterium]|nr:DEAD/DEAH box helicase [Phycisphaerales bacterium]